MYCIRVVATRMMHQQDGGSTDTLVAECSVYMYQPATAVEPLNKTNVRRARSYVNTTQNKDIYFYLLSISAKFWNKRRVLSFAIVSLRLVGVDLETPDILRSTGQNIYPYVCVDNDRKRQNRRNIKKKKQSTRKRESCSGCGAKIL